jgi:DinB superfamily
MVKPMRCARVRQLCMARDLSLFLAQTVKRELPHLQELTEERACIARAPGKWCPKEELGHLMDSAVNNHIRFVRGALEAEFRGPGYSQDDWVRLHDYKGMQWDTIVIAWFQHNLLLAALVNRIPEGRLGTPCFIGANPAVTLGFMIEDYVLHMQHHIDQLLGREIVTQYPGASLGS